MRTPNKVIFLLPLILVACGGTFPLFGAIDAPPAITANQQQNDISYCKVQAQDQANNNGEQVEAFLFGSAALQNDKTLQRKVFAECMTATGYTVVPVKVAKAEAPPTNQTHSS